MTLCMCENLPPSTVMGRALGFGDFHYASECIINRLSQYYVVVTEDGTTMESLIDIF